MRSFLRWISDRLPARKISDDGRPYLIRYYIGTVFGWRVYLHHFVGSDPAMGLHDHPWRRAVSVILAGWYWEDTRQGTRKVRWLNHLIGDSFHRVILPDGITCWTLFAHSVGDVKAWGFLTPEGDGAKFTPYAYPGGAKVPFWWLAAPKGREIRK